MDPIEQWRLREIQLVNWGTFDQAYYRIALSASGHLITGPSGSGKSTLLDALAVVLTPDKWLRLNDAAQSSRSRGARTVLSYVRGAWSQNIDDAEDRVVASFLRPAATWGGVALRYVRGTETCTLARLFFVRAGSSEVSSMCVHDLSALDLRDLEPFVSSGIEARKAKERFGSAVITTKANQPFYARMRRTFGIAHESALQLLHKTQSAKSLDSLDRLFRDYMLPVPRTFEMADGAVAQFGDLREAHEHVVSLRRQRDHLCELQTQTTEYEQARERAAWLGQLQRGIGSYQVGLKRTLMLEELAERQESAHRLAADLTRTDAERRVAQEALQSAHARLAELGGHEVRLIDERLDRARAERDRAAREFDKLTALLRTHQVARVPDNAAEFAELIQTIKQDPVEPGPTYEQQERLSQLRAHLAELDAEIQALRRHQSSLPAALLAFRDALAADLGLPASALPFAAELLRVRAEYRDWTGAIERVLRPLACTMLVPSAHLRAVRRAVDSTTIGFRLVFEEAGAEGAQPQPTAVERSLLHRIEIAPGLMHDWLSAALSRRYDYACVEHPDELGGVPRGVTINGQIKRSGRRYEKDDRRALSDRSQWVLGEPADRLEALIAKRASAQADYDAARLAVEKSVAAKARADRRAGALASLTEAQWHDYDVDHCQQRIAQLKDAKDALLRDSGDLSRAEADRHAAAERNQQAEAAYLKAHADQQVLAGKLAELTAEIAATPDAKEKLAPEVLAELDQRFSAAGRRLTWHRLAEAGQQIAASLRREEDLENSAAAGHETVIVRLMLGFAAQFGHAAVDLATEIAEYPGYLAILADIQARDLPRYESRFHELLQDRSLDLVGELAAEIKSAPDEIVERIRVVNDSLARSAFDEGRFLRLRVKVRRSDSVTRFLRDLRDISQDAFGERDLDRDEQRYAVLEALMDRLASSEPGDRRWRTECLDTRRHVTFLAEEIDDEQHVQATYDSGGAMSGGQQQKLVIFCLAAALRYQLGGPDDDYPSYGTIILDEAFDKADTRYTRMALDIFCEFGFHMVLATPQKLLQTIEPYVGGITQIENPTRRRSVISELAWE